jgi:hypothetical protein
MTEKKSEIERIKEDLKKSGFPTEIQVSSILVKHGWDVENQAYYLDPEENKERTVDVVAHKAFFERMGKHDRFNFSLIIECKKSEKPWVFYSSSRKSEVAYIHSVAAIKEFSHPDISKSPAYLKWIGDFHYTKCRNFAVNSHEPFTKGEGISIATAIHQVTKATMFRLEENTKSVSVIGMFPVFIYIPLIVFDGNLYECQPKTNDLEVVKQSSFLYSLVSLKVFLIDILELSFLDKYLDMVDSEVLSLKDAIKNM